MPTARCRRCPPRRLSAPAPTTLTLLVLFLLVSSGGAYSRGTPSLGCSSTPLRRFDSARISRNFRRAPPHFPQYAAADGVDASGAVPAAVDHGWTRRTLSLGLPAVVSSLSDPLLSLMDTAYTARLGLYPLAALGTCTSLFHLAFHSFSAVTVGTTALVGGARRRGDGRATRGIVRASLASAVVGGLVLATCLRYAAPSLLGAMGLSASSPSLVHALSYLRVRAFAAPAFLTIMVSEGTCRAHGDTRTAVSAAYAGGLVNAVLDPFFMYGGRYGLGMGVRGAALATATAQYVSLAIYLRKLKKMDVLPYFNSHRAGDSDGGMCDVADPDCVPGEKTDWSAILSANGTLLLRQSSLLFAWAFATSRAARLGPAVVAGHQVALSLWLVMALILDGASVAAQVMSSETDPTEKKVLRSLTASMALFALTQGCLAGTVAALPWARRCALSLSDDPAVGAAIRNALPALSAQMPLVSATLVAEGIVAGRARFGALAGGTVVATVASIGVLRRCTTLGEIWTYGIGMLFVGRGTSAILGVLAVNGWLPRGMRTGGGEEEEEKGGETER